MIVRYDIIHTLICNVHIYIYSILHACCTTSFYNNLAYKQYLSETGQAMKTLSVRSKNLTGIMIKAHQQSILCTGKKQQAAGISNIVLQTVVEAPYQL